MKLNLICINQFNYEFFKFKFRVSHSIPSSQGVEWLTSFLLDSSFKDIIFSLNYAIFQKKLWVIQMLVFLFLTVLVFTIKIIISTTQVEFINLFENFFKIKSIKLIVKNPYDNLIGRLLNFSSKLLFSHNVLFYQRNDRIWLSPWLIS